jgi:integration host factor subunit alpha
MTLTKADLVDQLTDELSMDRPDAKCLVNQFFEEIRSSLENGEGVKLAGFGNFDLRDKKSRPGRNPKTGDDCPITARRVVTFKASNKLKESVERNPVEAEPCGSSG